MNSTELEKNFLKTTEVSIKKIKKMIRFNKIYFIICSLVSSFYLFIFLINLNKISFSFNSMKNPIFMIIWILCAFITYKTFKKNKSTLNILTNEREIVLKEIDYPKYLREQREQKLDKIKKRVF